MIKDKNTFKDLTSFIQHAKNIEGVVGIVEYGGRTHSEMTLGGDYDLSVIFEKPVSKNFSGVHFHIAGIPIDCMILSVDDFSGPPQNEFLLAHLNCTILFDKNDVTKNILDKIKTSWKKNGNYSDYEKNVYRFFFQHIIDKLEHRLFDNELYSKFIIFSSFTFFLDFYARIKNLEAGKSKEHFNYIKTCDSELFNIVSKMFSSSDLEEQFELLKKCAEHILSPVGGLWASDEVLFHLNYSGMNDHAEQYEMMKLLFGE
jgi:hypothetical protein